MLGGDVVVEDEQYSGVHDIPRITVLEKDRVLLVGVIQFVVIFRAGISQGCQHRQ
jgi:hypothetical protein